MARARDPNRDRAFEIWKQSAGSIKLKDIADQLGISEGTIRGWKNKDRWEEQHSGTFQTKERSATKKAERSNGTEQNPDGVSWLVVEKEYVTDIRRKPCTFKSLSEKYNIPIQTIKEYALRSNWTDKRSRHRTTVLQKTTEKTAELISTDIAKVTARHLMVSDKLLSVIESALGDERQFYKYVEKLRTSYGQGEFDEELKVEVLDTLNEAKLLNTVSAMEKLQKMQRQLIGVLDEKDRRKIEMDRRRLFGEGEDDEEEDDGFIEALDGKVPEIWGDEDE
ncbi:phage terminase small subunit-related protein [uncultured Brevibacillus sp.]|uniref:phage terminase small subunit-related protein n=1 Tax=uncultured Brevibacillus sp. TaxID=169970 RepID=UPI002599D0F8|nr:phage terminase small subunit-related protein [uncultured Brevibacillus sp.]